MEDKHKYLIIGVVGLILVLLLIFRRSGGSGQPTVITTGNQQTGVSPEQAAIAQSTINAGIFHDILGYDVSKSAASAAERLASERIQTESDVSKRQSDLANLINSNQYNLDTLRAQIARDLGSQQIAASVNIAQAEGARMAQNANLENARYLSQLGAMQNQRTAQERQNAINSLLSPLAGLIRALSQRQSRSGSPSGSGVGSPPFVPTSNRRNTGNSATDAIGNLLADYYNRPLETGINYNPEDLSVGFYPTSDYNISSEIPSFDSGGGYATVSFDPSSIQPYGPGDVLGQIPEGTSSDLIPSEEITDYGQGISF